MSAKLKVEKINKIVFTTPHATVVVKNGLVDVIKVCRPAYKNGPVEHEERDIMFDSWSEFCQLADEVKEVAFQVDQELNK